MVGWRDRAPTPSQFGTHSHGSFLGVVYGGAAWASIEATFARGEERVERGGHAAPSKPDSSLTALLRDLIHADVVHALTLIAAISGA